jgi:hypothetical protein
MITEDYEYKIIGAIKNTKDKRSLVIEGIDWGYANPSYKGLPIVKETEHFFLCRVRGQTHRFSLSSFTYVSPKYIIFTKNGNTVKKALGDWELEYTKETMKDAKNKAVEEIRKREKEVKQNETA